MDVAPELSVVGLAASTPNAGSMADCDGSPRRDLSDEGSPKQVRLGAKRARIQRPPIWPVPSNIIRPPTTRSRILLGYNRQV